jgi:hypothetical protein
MVFDHVHLAPLVHDTHPGTSSIPVSQQALPGAHQPYALHEFWTKCGAVGRHIIACMSQTVAQLEGEWLLLSSSPP